MATPRYPSTLVTPGYIEGLTDRVKSIHLPILSRFLSSPDVHSLFEIASGPGVHLQVYREAFPHVKFTPSEPDQFGVEALRGKEGLEEPVQLDVMDESDWEKVEGTGLQPDIVLLSNALHMIPHPEGGNKIFSHLKALLNPEHGTFVVYGPFKSDAGFFSENDEKFNDMIRARPNGSSLGLRSIDELERIGQKYGFELKERIPMPLGNHYLIWSKV